MQKRGREIVWGRQINMHNLDKNAKVIIIYSLNPAWESTLRNTQHRAKLLGHSSFLAEFQAQGKQGPRVLCVGLATSQACPPAKSRVVQVAQTVVHSDFPHVAPCRESWEAVPLGSGPHCV